MGAPGTRLRSLLRAALHAAGGAPRLFRAARSAGAGPVESIRLLATSALVLFVVAPRAAGVPGRQNAVRHFVWQAVLTARHGEQVAHAVAEAQEHGSVRGVDSAIDRRNNESGRAYGLAHADRLSAASEPAALRTLLHVGLSRWDAGELAGLSDARAAARAARRPRRGWRGRATTRRQS